MTSERSRWTRTVLAAALSGAVWAIAAGNGYALETIWLPAIVVAAAWARRSPRRLCLPRLLKSTARRTSSDPIRKEKHR
jgi:hypothetical protein